MSSPGGDSQYLADEDTGSQNCEATMSDEPLGSRTYGRYSSLLDDVGSSSLLDLSMDEEPWREGRVFEGVSPPCSSGNDHTSAGGNDIYIRFELPVLDEDDSSLDEIFGVPLANASKAFECKHRTANSTRRKGTVGDEPNARPPLLSSAQTPSTKPWGNTSSRTKRSTSSRN